MPWSVCAYVQAGLSLCWLHIPHCWKILCRGSFVKCILPRLCLVYVAEQSIWKMNRVVNTKGNFSSCARERPALDKYASKHRNRTQNRAGTQPKVQVCMCVQRRFIQASLHIRTVWSESKFPAWRKVKPLATHRATIEDSDQTAQSDMSLRCTHMPTSTFELLNTDSIKLHSCIKKSSLSTYKCDFS